MIGAGNGPVLAVKGRIHAAGRDDMSVAARTIVELNIKHYRDLLQRETDAAKRQTITRLLAGEEAKLAKLVAAKDAEERK